MVKRLVKKIMDKVLNTDDNKKLDIHKSRLERAKTAWGNEQSRMKEDQKYYDGSREVTPSYNSNKPSTKLSNNVRNIVYELIESQVDTAIPSPKIKPIHEEDSDLATMIENLLRNEVVKLHCSVLNDINERNTPVLGGDFAFIEWDESAGYHCNLGDIAISERSPRQVIPQPDITDIDKMDYIFITSHVTKKYVKKHYGIDVSEAQDEEPDDSNVDTIDYSDDLVTVNTEYYKNDNGGIGIFAWCDVYILLDMENYQKRQKEVCVKCGAVKTADVCPVCGSKKFKKVFDDYEEMADVIKQYDGTVIGDTQEVENPQLDENGQPVMDEAGQPVTVITHEKKKIPYYVPDVYPIILRKNVSRDKYFLGYSDVEVIKDQQETIKKLGNKINEKLLKGGSFVTLPKGVGVKTTDEELKIIRLDNPSQKNLIDVLNVQPDISKDESMLEQNYSWAKSTLGITDSFQGKYDASATSGTAKQYAINQAAGRLESKRVLKNEYWSRIYEIMFKFMLSYADQPIPLVNDGTDGSLEFGHFNRYDFLKIDANGEFYWDDEFIFDVDPTSAIMSNREAMWNANDLKLQSGAFGQVGDLQTALLYWTLQEKHSYPNAGEIKKMIEARIQEQQAQTAQMGAVNEVSDMPVGSADIVQ